MIAAGGTGLTYGASIILMMTKAKLKEDGTNQSGIIVTAKPQKNRYVKPVTVKFHISYYQGMNPYVGLENYLNWDNAGIQRGKFIDEKEYSKLTPSQLKDARTYVGDDGNTYYVLLSDTARGIAVKHLNKCVKLSEYFTPYVITDKVLEDLAPYIEQEFTYNNADLEAITSIIEEEGETE